MSFFINIASVLTFSLNNNHSSCNYNTNIMTIILCIIVKNFVFNFILSIRANKFISKSICSLNKEKDFDSAFIKTI